MEALKSSIQAEEVVVLMTFLMSWVPSPKSHQQIPFRRKLRFIVDGFKVDGYIDNRERV